LFTAGGATKVEAPHEIASAVSVLWRDAESRAAQAEAARRVAEQGADAFAHTLSSLTALLAPQTQSPRALNATA